MYCNDAIKEVMEKYGIEISEDVVSEIEWFFDDVEDACHGDEETEITRETGVGILSEDEEELIEELAEAISDDDIDETLEELIEEISEGYCDVRDEIKEKIECFFDENNGEAEIAKKCIEALTQDGLSDVETILEFVKDEVYIDVDPLDGDGDDCSGVVKEMTYDVWAECDEDGELVLRASVKFGYYYREDCNDSFDISEEEFERRKDEYARGIGYWDDDYDDDDERDEDEDWEEDDYDEEYVSDEYGVPMHHVGDGVYCDDDGDNWEF